MEWLQTLRQRSTRQKGKHVSISAVEAMKYREIALEFIFWFFEWFLIPLIRVNKYSSRNPITNYYLLIYIIKIK